jgi:hypothetical protein
MNNLEVAEKYVHACVCTYIHLFYMWRGSKIYFYLAFTSRTHGYIKSSQSSAVFNLLMIHSSLAQEKTVWHSDTKNVFFFRKKKNMHR